MRFLAPIAVLMGVAACSPNLHMTEISEFSRSVGTLQTTLSSLRDEAYEATIETKSRDILRLEKIPLVIASGCSVQTPDNCGLKDKTSGKKFPPDKNGEELSAMLKLVSDYARSMRAMAGSDDAAAINKAIDRMKKSLEGMANVVDEMEGAQSLGLGLDALKASPDAFATLAKAIVDQKRHRALKMSVTAAQSRVAKAAGLLKLSISRLKEIAVSTLDSRLRRDLSYLKLTKDCAEVAKLAKPDRVKCQRAKADRLAYMKELVDSSLRLRSLAGVNTDQIVENMVAAHTALANAYKADGNHAAAE